MSDKANKSWQECMALVSRDLDARWDPKWAALGEEIDLFLAEMEEALRKRMVVGSDD